MKTKMLLVAIMFLPGCQYYQVTEPAGRHSYITDNWHMSANGFVFTDLKTGDTVRLMSAEYRPISSADALDGSLACGVAFSNRSRRSRRATLACLLVLGGGRSPPQNPAPSAWRRDDLGIRI